MVDGGGIGHCDQQAEASGPDARMCVTVKTFDALFAELTEAATRPAGPGTVAALDAGVHAQGKKLLEEAGEVWLAAEHEEDDASPWRSPSCSTARR